MATFDDNIKTIKTAIYGKEMRPAIAEALYQSMTDVEVMMGAVRKLNERVDALPSGGGSGGDEPGGGGVAISDKLIPPILVVYGTTTDNVVVANIPAISA